jgi:cytochrome c oxidase subunit II
MVLRNWSYLVSFVETSRLHSPASFPVFSPHSPYARSISDLSSAVLWAMLGIFVIVTAMVAYCIRRFRATKAQLTPQPTYGNTRLEVGYTISFFLILATIMVFAIRSMNASDPANSQPDTLVVVAHQWWWGVRYPGTDIVTANEIHVPVGVSQRLRLLSADVIHDFWVPELGRKMDIIPDVENHIWFSADAPGTYFGTCAEFCGVEHAWMRIRVVAQPPAEFAEWQAQQEEVPAIPASGEAALGAQYFQQLSCANCHAIRGTVATASIAPDLTHFASRETLAAGRMTNTAENLSNWLNDPGAIKLGCKMPNLHLTAQQRGALVDYLETLR